MPDEEKVLLGARQKFLSSFPAGMRSTVANVFHSIVRRGVKEPAEIVNIATREFHSRLKWAKQHNSFGDIYKWQIAVDVLAQKPQLSKEYARWVLYWESTPYPERAKIKQQRALAISRPYWYNLPPTERQLNLLVKLGYEGPVFSRGYASELIDQLTSEGDRCESSTADSGTKVNGQS